MSKVLMVSIPIFFGVLMLAPTVRADTLVEFEGGIGVLTADGVTCGQDPTNCFVRRNDVRGVQPGGQPWVIRQFKAKVKTNGRITAEGKGLVLAGSNAIGTADGVNLVAVTLFCAEETTPDGHSSGSHPLAADGDFKFTDTLSPPVPATCPTPTLLIRARINTGQWIAAGIPEVGPEAESD